LVALAGVAAASGVGSAASSYLNQLMNEKEHDEVDFGTVVIDGLWGAIGGALSLGMAGVGGSTCQTLAQNFALRGKDLMVQIGNDFSAAVIISAATWFNGTKMSMIRDGKAILSSSF
jgi:hypothetical protein